MRILVYRLGSLGDTLVALPCFRLIRKAYPQAKITVLTNFPVSGMAAPLESILANTNLIDQTIPYPVGLRDVRKLANLRNRIAHENFSLVISLAAARGLAASVRDYLFFRACGISNVIGIPWSQRDLVPQLDGKVYENEEKRLLRRIATLGMSEPETGGLDLTKHENEEAQLLLQESEILHPFIAASIGTKSPANDWGQENWTNLLTALSGEFPQMNLVLLGSPQERERSDTLSRAWAKGQTANLCGRTSPRVSAAILSRAQLFIGHDSGPMHLAAAVGTRCVSVFSAKNRPGQWFPRGSGHINLYPLDQFDPKRMADLNHQKKAISSISVADVLAAAKSCLSSST